MDNIPYLVCTILTIGAMVFMAVRSYNNIDMCYWGIMLMNSVVVFAFWLKYLATTPEGVTIAYVLTFIDSSLIIEVLFVIVLKTVKHARRPWAKGLIYTTGFAHLLAMVYCMKADMFEVSKDITDWHDMYGIRLKPGLPHYFHYLLLALVFTLTIGFAVYGLSKKGLYSRHTLYTCLGITVLKMTSYILEVVFDHRFSTMSVACTISQIILAIDYDYTHIHDIGSLISQQHTSDSVRGYIALSMKRAYLGCNQKAEQMLPFLAEQPKDVRVTPFDETTGKLNKLIDDFENKNVTDTELRIKDTVFNANISYFSIRKSGDKQGFLICVRDTTEEKRNLEILTNYNSTLNEEVAQKTANIEFMQRKIVLGMATMIENRDDNTGGHVKRTSETIKILVDEIRKRGIYDLSEEDADDIIRATPMHDLGKLHIDSSVFMKPDKLTDEEYALMKEHPVKSGAMVKMLLEGVEAKRFVEIAYNIARFHHERWDGRGYPEGLVGGMIPVEARIVALVDVYDALVSERSYKKTASFREASDIIADNMGTQFDPNLKQAFMACRGKLEQYYSDSFTVEK